MTERVNQLAAWPGLGARFVLLVPDLGLLLDGRGLRAPNAIGQNLGEILAAFLAAGSRQHRPEIGLVHILGNAMTAPVKQAQLVLGRDAAIFGGFSEPTDGFPLILRDCLFFIALRIEEAKGIFGGGIAVLREFAKLFGSGGSDG